MEDGLVRPSNTTAGALTSDTGFTEDMLEY